MQTIAFKISSKRWAAHFLEGSSSEKNKELGLPADSPLTAAK
jgi:hypothetical protein